MVWVVRYRFLVHLGDGEGEGECLRGSLEGIRRVVGCLHVSLTILLYLQVDLIKTGIETENEIEIDRKSDAIGVVPIQLKQQEAQIRCFLHLLLRRPFVC